MSLGGVHGFEPERLRLALAKAGLSGRAAAATIGVSSQSVFSWLAGRVVPDPHSLKRLADGLGCKTTYLAPLPARPTLADFRERLGQTQADVAELVGAKGWLVSRVEHGLRWPEDLDEWARVYGVTPQVFARAWRTAPTPPAST